MFYRTNQLTTGTRHKLLTEKSKNNNPHINGMVKMEFKNTYTEKIIIETES